MSPQQFLDAAARGPVGTARSVKKTPQLVGSAAIQGFEKDRLGIDFDVTHGLSPIIVLYSMPRLRRNPPRHAGKIGLVGDRRGKERDLQIQNVRDVGHEPSLPATNRASKRKELALKEGQSHSSGNEKNPK